MVIRDCRNNRDFVPLRHPSIQIGDVVEADSGRIALVVWADEKGRPTYEGPPLNGLLYLDRYTCCTSAAQFPKVRKLIGRLFVNDPSAEE